MPTQTRSADAAHDSTDPIRAQAHAIAIANTPYCQGGDHFPAFEDWDAVADEVAASIERAVRREVSA